MKNKNWAMLGIIYFVILVMYNLIVFLCFDNFNNIFWISYAFMLVFYFMHIACIFIICKNINVNAVFFGIPLTALSIFFLCAEFFVSMMFIFFRSKVGVTPTILIQVLLLCIYIVVAVVAIMSRDYVQGVDNKIKQNVNFIQGINVDVEMMMQRSQYPQVTMALKQLSETIKYSDPMKNDIVAPQEQMINQYMMQMRMAFDSSDMNTVLNLCNNINLLFIERNKKLMISK